jgi:hypothetical protein
MGPFFPLTEDMHRSIDSTLIHRASSDPDLQDHADGLTVRRASIAIEPRTAK